MSMLNPRLVLWMFWIQLVVIKQSVQLVPQTSYLKIESQTSSLCPASKERRMCSQQATYLQASRTRSQQESTPGLEEEKKMLGVRGTSLHSAGRGRGARYLCTWPAISQPGISTRYRHLYKRSGELSSVEISQSIREIFGTAHILDVAPQNSCEGESEISDSQSSNLSNTFEEAVTDDNRSGKIFICPLCGQDFSHIGSFSKHNEREHNDKIEQLEMFSYVAAKTGCEDQDS